MLVLAIDTSGDVSGIALANEKQTISELHVLHRMDLLRRLMPNIDYLLKDAKKTRSDLEGIVISLGPGSFTGLRIGMAAAKSMSQVLHLPIVGISTLDVLAHSATAANPKSIAALIHARLNEVFWALYRNESGTIERLTEDAVSTVEEMISRARAEESVVFCGDGAERNRAFLEAQFGLSSVLDEWYNWPRAAVLAKLGIRRLLAGHSDDLFQLEPEYVRKPTPVIRLEAAENS